MEIEDSIHVEAPPGVVWTVTVEIERWPEWTPTVTSVTRLDEGPFAIGSVARIKQPLQPESDWVVTELESGRRFAWKTRRLGLQMKGVHELTPEAGGTKNVLRLEAAGALAVLLWPLFRIAVRRALRDENRGLKARCERIVGNGSGSRRSEG